MTPPDDGRAESPDDTSLHTLLRRSVVRIDDSDGAFRGTGFFVAPGEVLTCAHVVHACAAVVATWDSGSSSAVVAAALPPLSPDDRLARFYPFPDVALLRLIDPPPDHPCVRLDHAVPVLGPPVDVLVTMAWTADEYAPGTAIATTATFEYEGCAQPVGGELLKLKNGQVAHGFSGAPLVVARTGEVGALLDSTRDRQSALGGFGVPVAAFLDALPGLGERSRAFHAHDDRWTRAVERDRVTRVLLAGLASRLPLSPARMDLDWEPGGSRAELLHPRFGVVPFLGRDDLLAQLMLWRESPDPLRVAVLGGPGGFGKTRTAIEVCAAAERTGWTAGLLGESAGGTSVGLDALAAWPGRLVVAVDYAEVRPPGAVAELLRRLLFRPVPARVVLVMRRSYTPEEMRELFATGDDRLELDQLIRSADVVRLDRDVAGIDRVELFGAATTAFAELLGRRAPRRTPALDADHFARPLFVIAAALLSTAEVEVNVDELAADDVLGAVLDRHEAEYWDRWNRRLEVGLDRDQQRRAVALAALLGAETEEEALSVARRVPGLGGASDGRIHDVARWLARLYGTGRLDEWPAIRPLEPDLLAEVLIAREMVAGGPG